MRGPRLDIIVLYCIMELFPKLHLACEDIAIRNHTFPGYYYHYNNVRDLYSWHNMSFWGGQFQMPSINSIETECFRGNGNVFALKGAHPQLTTLNENIKMYTLCSVNQERVCEMEIGNIEMRKCHGILLYRIPTLDFSNLDITAQFYCFERKYFASCDVTTTVYSATNLDEKFVHFQKGGLQFGWFNAYINGIQFVPPSIAELNGIFSQCLVHGRGFALLEPVPRLEENIPLRLRICYISDKNDISDCYSSHEDKDIDENYIHARNCKGEIQFDFNLIKLRDWNELICLVHQSSVKPEIGHNITYYKQDDKTFNYYSPFLQYRCVFPVKDDMLYRINWYVNGTLHAQLGPSRNQDELVLKAETFSSNGHTYEVQCGVITIIGNDENELMSFVLRAGWMILDDSITLSKNGHAYVYVKQTIPIGCYYNDNEESNCEEELIVETESKDACTGRISVQNDKMPNESFMKIKSLKKGEQWTTIIHKARITTVDSNYDDATNFDLHVRVTNRSGQDKRIPVLSKDIGVIHVKVTNSDRHRNKRCYSHVDPHMRTVDGLYYEAQREGDYMLYRNKDYQTEVQQSARYCSPGSNSGPVCACGIAIAVGADTFIFNKCFNTTFRFDLRCEDGGLVDIDEVHPHRYVVRTPFGTIIDVSFHGWSNTMNIDIYMSAKDYGNVDGLCGTFDGNRSNDLLHRDKMTISDDDNLSYRFADSWRLSDEENLFKTDARLLTPFNTQTNGIEVQPCSRPNSITKRKCQVNRRNRRATQISVKHKYRSEASESRDRRSTDSLTNEEAFALCNSSIYNTPAVMEFPDYLAEEDPDIIVDQCVYDLTHGNDTGWIDAHVTNVNNVADTVLNLNPVFVANNTDKVNTFRSHICLNNCSGNGDCLKTGLGIKTASYPTKCKQTPPSWSEKRYDAVLIPSPDFHSDYPLSRKVSEPEKRVCECNGTFRGPDCSDDIRIPPVVYGIEGNGICEIREEDDCTCFEIRSDNIFDGFMCDISKHRVYLNGTRVQMEQSIHAGYYEDIFTGECCAPNSRKRRFEEINNDGPFVISYDISVSNDGAAYGEINTVFVYDTTCLTQSTSEVNITIHLKDGYCFINGVCVVRNFLSAVDCLLCDPASNHYRWTIGICKERDSQMTTEMIIGIAIGCTVVVVIISVLFGYRMCCKRSRKNRQVHDSSISLQTKVSSIQTLPGELPGALPVVEKTSFKFYKHKL